GIGRQRATDMKGRGADDAQTFARAPAARGQSAGRYAVERDVAGTQTGEEPRQRVQVTLHVNVTLAATVNLLPLTGGAAGHIHQRDFLTRDAQSLAEGRMRVLICEKIGLGRSWEYRTERGQRCEPFRIDARRVH